MRVLITGGSGYLGSVLTPMLLQAGHEVTVLDNFMYRQNSLTECCADPKFTLTRGDCRDLNLMNELLRDADFFLPLAAIVGAPACDRNLDCREINYSAIERVLYGKPERWTWPRSSRYSASTMSRSDGS